MERLDFGDEERKEGELELIFETDYDKTSTQCLNNNGLKHNGYTRTVELGVGVMCREKVCYVIMFGMMTEDPEWHGI